MNERPESPYRRFFTKDRSVQELIRRKNAAEKQPAAKPPLPDKK